MTVIADINGGLGNQLFMYAAGLSLSLYHQTSLKLDLTNLRNHTRHGGYYLDQFKIDQNFAATGDLTTLRPVFKHLDHQFGEYLPEILNTPKDVYLYGYWQSELYFKSIEKELREKLQFKNELIGENLLLAQEINLVDAVSVHIRRGDYANYPTLFNILPLSYYQRAMGLITEIIPTAHFYVFSDDILWAKENIKTKQDITFVSHNGPSSMPYNDLHLMSRCKHHIISNSTFGWWGAWLNPNTDKAVIAPSPWFTQLPAPDIIPASWIKL